MTPYTEKDFSRLAFNPMGKRKLADSQLKELLKYFTDEGEEEGKEELLTPAQYEPVLRWVVAMYDQQSPLTKAYPDVKARKVKAAEAAGIEDEKLIDRLLEGSIVGLAAVINKYLQLYGQNRLWAMIVAQEAQFWEYQYRLLKPVDGNKDKEILQSIELKSKIAAELDATSSRLDNYYSRLYGDDQELMSISKAKRLTPETIADVLKN